MWKDSLAGCKPWMSGLPQLSVAPTSPPSNSQHWFGLSYSPFPSSPFYFGTSYDIPDSLFCTFCTAVHSHSCDLSSPFLLHQANSLAAKQCILGCKPTALSTSLTAVKGQVWAPSIPAISSPSMKHQKCHQISLPTRGAQCRITPQMWSLVGHQPH